MWAIGCVLYEMAALKRAFEAPTLPALILKIMRGVTPPLPAQYSPGARQLLVSLLALEPQRRPSIPEIMSHHWLAPYIFRHPDQQLSRCSLTDLYLESRQQLGLFPALPSRIGRSQLKPLR